MKNKTAVLIFANSAEKEAERKSFLSADVFSALNNQIIKTVEKSGIEYFHISDKQQIGNSFGERFLNAIEAVFDKNFNNVITIGNDTPHLKTHHLLDTLRQLEKNDFVLGPSKDGGFYLMGIKKEHFNKETFLQSPWQTNHLHNYFSSIASAQNLQLHFLEPLHDIDSKEDIKLIIQCFNTITNTILKLLQKLFYAIQKPYFKAQSILLETSYAQNLNKGSPLI
jgi:glycosyltransferase A (GT-A) superfamily protein (DUF2064 family)